MPITLPNLDDRSYADLLAEVRAAIPQVAPGWTDHNPSDPGVVLLELLAWLTEQLIYQADQVPEASYDAFLGLLNGPGYRRIGALDDAIGATLRHLRAPYRAVTAADYELLATTTWNTEQAALALTGPTIARARCLPGFRPDGAALSPQAGHTTLVVLPAARASDTTDQLLAALWRWFDGRRLLGTCHHIIAPGYRALTVTAALTLHPDTRPADVGPRAAARVAAFFDPYTGGPDGGGWPFGRAVYLSELYQLLDQVPGVDHLPNQVGGGPPIRVTGVPDERSIRRADGGVVGFALLPHEVVRLTQVTITADGVTL